MKKNNTVVVIDGGGRGSVLVDKYLQSKYVSKVIAIPGNDWIKHIYKRKVRVYPGVKTTAKAKIIKICKKEKADLIDVAQDSAVQVGIIDALQESGFNVIGPTKSAGQIEWDKAWSRKFISKLKISQPSYKICKTTTEGKKHIERQPDQKWFIKASFLAEGKGALPAKNNKEAIEKIIEIKHPKFKGAGDIYLVEKWLTSDNGTPGEEFSTFALCDGSNFTIMGCAQDHKRAFNFDKGENTGGMGCSTPPLVLTHAITKNIETEIIKKVVNGLNSAKRPYKGILYLGGILVRQKGKLHPYVIEFNARWGDPEAQVIVPGIVNDLFETSMSIAQENFSNTKILTDGKTRVVVTGASRGYPGDYSQAKGKQVYGLDEARKLNDIKIYGAGLKVEDSKYYANGGRLFYIVSEGETVIEARKKAYEAISLVHIQGNNLHYRTDIGWRDVERLRR